MQGKPDTGDGKTIVTTAEVQAVYDSFRARLENLSTEIREAVSTEVPLTDGAGSVRKTDWSKVFTIGLRALIATATALGTLATYGITNYPDMQHVIINSAVNVFLNMRDVPGEITGALITLVEDIRGLHQLRQEKGWKSKSFRDRVRGVIARYFATLAGLGASFGPAALTYQGTLSNIGKYISGWEGPANIGSIMGAVVIAVLYGGPVAGLFLAETGDPETNLILKWIEECQEKALFTKNPEAIKEWLRFVGGLNFTDRDGLSEGMKAVYKDRKENFPILSALVPSEIYKVKGVGLRDLGSVSTLFERMPDRSWSRYGAHLALTVTRGVAAPASFAACVHGLAPSTAEGLSAFLGIPMSDAVAGIWLTAEAYFLMRNVLMALELMMNLVERSVNQLKRGNYFEALLTLVLTGAMIYVAIITVSTILAQKSGTAKPASPMEEAETYTIAGSAFAANFLAIIFIALQVGAWARTLLARENQWARDAFDPLQPVCKNLLTLMQETLKTESVSLDPVEDLAEEDPIKISEASRGQGRAIPSLQGGEAIDDPLIVLSGGVLSVIGSNELPIKLSESSGLKALMEQLGLPEVEERSAVTKSASSERSSLLTFGSESLGGGYGSSLTNAGKRPKETCEI